VDPPLSCEGALVDTLPLSIDCPRGFDEVVWGVGNFFDVGALGCVSTLDAIV
jgi:hypothetical protein